MLRMESPHPHWYDSMLVFAELMHARFTRLNGGDPTYVNDLVAELDCAWRVPHTRPAPRLSTIECPTWWETAPIEYEGNPVQCQLDRRHAAPHVNLQNNDVRLGHEPFLQHCTPDHVQQSMSEYPGGVTYHAFAGYGLFIAHHWWLHLTRTHDCHTCPHCPREVW